MTLFVEFDDVDEFTAATIGEPGSRVFYLTARSGSHRVTVRCEKQQVRAIATYLRHVLNDLPPVEDRPMIGPTPTDETVLDPAFILGPIGLGYDRRHDRLLVQLEEFIPDVDDDDELDDEDLEDDDDDDDDDLELGDGFDDLEIERDDSDDIDRGHIRFYLTRSQAAAFCEHADQVVAAGRQACPWCSLPIDPSGHACPRMN